MHGSCLSKHLKWDGDGNWGRSVWGIICVPGGYCASCFSTAFMSPHNSPVCVRPSMHLCVCVCVCVCVCAVRAACSPVEFVHFRLCVCARVWVWRDRGGAVQQRALHFERCQNEFVTESVNLRRKGTAERGRLSPGAQSLSDWLSHTAGVRVGKLNQSMLGEHGMTAEK